MDDELAEFLQNSLLEQRENIQTTLQRNQIVIASLEAEISAATQPSACSNCLELETRLSLLKEIVEQEKEEIERAHEIILSRNEEPLPAEQFASISAELEHDQRIASVHAREHAELKTKLEALLRENEDMQTQILEFTKQTKQKRDANAVVRLFKLRDALQDMETSKLRELKSLRTRVNVF